MVDDDTFFITVECGVGPVCGAVDEEGIIDDDEFMVEESWAVADGYGDMVVSEGLDGCCADALGVMVVVDDFYVYATFLSFQNLFGDGGMCPGEHSDF